MRQILSRSVLTVAAASSILAVTGGYADADSDARSEAVGSPGVLSGNTISAPVEVPVNACGNTVNIVAAANPAFGNTCANVSQGPRHEAGHTRSGHGGQGHTGQGADGGADAGSGSGGPGHTGSGNGSSGHTGSAQSGSGHTGSGSAGAGADSGDHSGRGSGHGGSRHGDSGGTRGAGASGHQVAEGSPGVISGNAADAPVSVPVNACGNSVDVIALLNPAMGNSCANVSESSSVSTPPPHRPRPQQPPHTAPQPGGPKLPEPRPASHSTPKQPQLTPVGDTYTQVHDGPAHAGLARTGIDGNAIGAAGSTAVGLLLGGAILYRRGRRATARIR